MLALLVAWACFFALHSLLAANQSKNWFRQRFPRIPFRYYRVWYNVFFLCAIVALVYYQLTVPSALLFRMTTVSKLSAALLGLAGFVLMLLAVRNYDAKSFLGLTDVHSEPLQVRGLNRYMRHPLYTGTTIFLAGAFLYFPYYKHLYFLGLYMAYLVIGMWLEEKKLTEIYGDQYRQYQQRVKRLIPGVW